MVAGCDASSVGADASREGSASLAVRQTITILEDPAFAAASTEVQDRIVGCVVDRTPSLWAGAGDATTGGLTYDEAIGLVFRDAQTSAERTAKTSLASLLVNQIDRCQEMFLPRE